MTPALVLSCHNTGLGVIRSLGAVGVPVVALYYDAADTGQMSRYCVARRRLPSPEHAKSRFVTSLSRVLREYGGGVVIPCDDETLIAVSKHREKLSSLGTVACCSWDIVRAITQKEHTYGLAEAHGIPHPRTFLPATLEEASEAGRAIGFPCLVKPCESHVYFRAFRRKLAKVWSERDLATEYLRAVTTGHRVMVQEFIPGSDTGNINYNSYARGGEVLADLTAQKVRLSPPESGVPCVVRSARVPEVSALAVRMLAALRYDGYSCIELKRDPRDGTYKLLEVNGRFNRSVLLGLACGINFPEILYRHLVEGKLPGRTAWREGTYWIDPIGELRSSYRYLARRDYGLYEFVKPYVRPHVFAGASARDPMPSVGRAFALARKALSAIQLPVRYRREKAR